jgi:hypothetical protein
MEVKESNKEYSEEEYEEAEEECEEVEEEIPRQGILQQQHVVHMFFG